MVESVLHPKTIAVVGASVDPSKVGHQIFSNLLSFSGQVYPVNPKHLKILGVATHPDILSIPDHIDLVVVATPAGTVPDIVHQCVDKKVKAICIISAGFAENGSTGRKMQEKIAKICQLNGIALVGPNTLGAVNPYMGLNASFAPAEIQKGTIGLISQSGAMLTTIFAELSSRNVGCSFALSLGNSAGITATDALEYAASDPHTNVIAIYVESIDHIPKFFATAKKVSKNKPIILLKGGLTSQGQQASLSHTAALATDSTLLREAAYQFGYTCVETIEQFFETTFFLDRLYARSGRRLSLPKNLLILTNAGGPGVNAVDVAVQEGVELATWSGVSHHAFARQIPRVKPANPTDLLGDASVSDIHHALAIAQEDPLIESILLIITPQAVTDIPGITKMLVDEYGKDSACKPLIVALMGGEAQRPFIKKLRAASITAVDYANEGVEIFAYTNRARKAQLIDRSAAIMQELEVALGTQEPNEEVLRRRVSLTSNRLAEVYLLLEKYGLTLPHAAIVSSKEQLDELDELEPQRVYPLIAKTANLKLKHKAVLGAVIKDIQNKDDAVVAYEKLEKFGQEVLYQEVIEDAVEVIIGCKRDPIFGVFVAIGMGGSLTNILADRSYVFVPASAREVRSSLRRTRLYSKLSAEQRSLVLLNLERFIEVIKEHPEIVELEINPLMVTAHQAYVADVKVDLLPTTQM